MREAKLRNREGNNIIYITHIITTALLLILILLILLMQCFPSLPFDVLNQCYLSKAYEVVQLWVCLYCQIKNKILINNLKKWTHACSVAFNLYNMQLKSINKSLILRFWPLFFFIWTVLFHLLFLLCLQCFLSILAPITLHSKKFKVNFSKGISNYGIQEESHT